MKFKDYLKAVPVLAVMLLLIATGTAGGQSSAHFRVKKAVTDQGGAASQTNQFKTVDAIGQPTAAGAVSSAQFRFHPGIFTNCILSKSIARNFTAGWSMFSINVNPADPNLATVMQAITAKLKLIKNSSGQTYYPAYGINQIGDISFKEGYQAYFHETATLQMRGLAVVPTTPIDLPESWSIISYLPDLPIDIETALASITNHLKLVKNGSGQTYYPQYGINQIGQMQPGQGYQIFMNTAATLVYPGGHQLAQTNSSPTTAEVNVPRAVERRGTTPQHFRFTDRTGENATIIVLTGQAPRYSDGSVLEHGDEIGAFTADGRCCGAVVWEGENSALTVWGNNSATDSLDGFQVGESFSFRVWNKRAEVEFSARAGFQKGHASVYQINGLSTLTKLVADLSSNVDQLSEAGVPTEFRLLQNYPNPFNPETRIEYHLPQAARVVLIVYDIQGHEVRRLVSGKMPAGYHAVRWNGRNAAGRLVASGLYFYRVEVVPEEAGLRMLVDFRKMILMK